MAKTQMILVPSCVIARTGGKGAISPFWGGTVFLSGPGKASGLKVDS